MLEVYQSVVAKARNYDADKAQELLGHLHRDQIDTSGASFKLPSRGHSPLQPLAAVATSLTADQLHTQIERIHASIESDPALAIGTAKELVETTCKTILVDLDEDHATLDLGDLVKGGYQSPQASSGRRPQRSERRRRDKENACAASAPRWRALVRCGISTGQVMARTDARAA